MEKRFEIIIGVNDNENDSSLVIPLSREHAKVLAMALDIQFIYDADSDDVAVLQRVDLSCDEDVDADRYKDDRLLIGCLPNEREPSDSKYRFKMDVHIEEQRYDNYYSLNEDGHRLYYSALEGFREELDKITDALDKLP